MKEEARRVASRLTRRQERKGGKEERVCFGAIHDSAMAESDTTDSFYPDLFDVQPISPFELLASTVSFLLIRRVQNNEKPSNPKSPRRPKGWIMEVRVLRQNSTTPHEKLAGSSALIGQDCQQSLSKMCSIFLENQDRRLVVALTLSRDFSFPLIQSLF